MHRSLGRLALFVAAGSLVLSGCASAEDASESGGDDSSGNSSGNSSGSEAVLTDKGGIVVTGADLSDDVGDTGSPVEVIVYEDFQCPYCGALEESAGDYIEDALENGEITVEYRTVSFLDQASQNEFSSRAANAALCVYDAAGASAFFDFHETLFENQPDEGTAGPDDDQLTAYASDAGADVAACIADRSMADQVAATTKQMQEDGVTGTPTVTVDGEQVEITSETSVQDAIESAIGTV
ncbi:MAG: DsbA family protein [Actinomycetia bacterium]|nr:DsbA family protein [Actinomycetes bacterium]